MDMEDIKKPTVEELAERLTAVEQRASKLDRLVYKLFEEIKRLILREAMTGTNN
jgi:hypothetical protein